MEESVEWLDVRACEIVITNNGQEIGRLIPKEKTISYHTDSLTGILKGNYDIDEEKGAVLREKYEIID